MQAHREEKKNIRGIAAPHWSMNTFSHLELRQWCFRENEWSHTFSVFNHNKRNHSATVQTETLWEHAFVCLFQSLIKLLPRALVLRKSPIVVKWLGKASRWRVCSVWSCSGWHCLALSHTPTCPEWAHNFIVVWAVNISSFTIEPIRHICIRHFSNKDSERAWKLAHSSANGTKMSSAN